MRRKIIDLGPVFFLTFRVAPCHPNHLHFIPKLLVYASIMWMTKIGEATSNVHNLKDKIRISDLMQGNRDDSENGAAFISSAVAVYA